MRGKILKWSGILILIAVLNIIFDKIIQSWWHTGFSLQVGFAGLALTVSIFLLGAWAREMIKWKCKR